jgi:hypothetical protein
LSVSDFRASYLSVFHDYVVRTGEDSLRAGYELGREAVCRGLSLLDLAEIHNEALLYEMGLGIVDPEVVARSGGELFLESISAFEMVRRGFEETRDAALLQRSHVEMLRQLSNILADTSLVSDSPDSLEEVLRLVAEQSCELIGARLCVVSLTGYGRLLRASSYSVGIPDEVGEPAAQHPVTIASLPGSAARLAAALRSLDGKELGSIEVFGKKEFSAVDRAALVHLSQMVSAALERLSMYVIEHGTTEHG